jgi:predicted Zn-dependent peptidase
VAELLMQAAFGTHPLGRRVAGAVHTVSLMGRKDLARFRRKNCRAGNICCVVAGRFVPEEVMAEVNRRCSEWPRGAGSGRRSPPSFRPTAILESRSGLRREQIALGVPFEPLGGESLAAARLATLILGGYSGSRLYWAIEDKGLADSVDAWHQSYSDAGLLCVAFACQPSRAERLCRIVLSEMRKMMEYGVSREELERAKNTLKTELVFSAETPFSRLIRDIENWNARRCVPSVADEIAEIESVTPHAVAGLLSKWRLDTPPAAAALGPLTASEFPIERITGGMKGEVIRLPQYSMR